MASAVIKLQNQLAVQPQCSIHLLKDLPFNLLRVQRLRLNVLSHHLPQHLLLHCLLQHPRSCRLLHHHHLMRRPLSYFPACCPLHRCLMRRPHCCFLMCYPPHYFRGCRHDNHHHHHQNLHHQNLHLHQTSAQSSSNTSSPLAAGQIVSPGPLPLDPDHCVERHLEDTVAIHPF